MKTSGILRMLIAGVVLISAAGAACGEIPVANVPEITGCIEPPDLKLEFATLFFDESTFSTDSPLFLLARQSLQDRAAVSAATGERQLRIPAGRAPLIDGVPSPGEWEDAGTASIQVRPRWIVTVRYKSADSNLYVAFFNLASPDSKEFRFPEVLLDVKNEKSELWTDNQWWFHGSFTDCQSRGKFNDYSSCLKVAKNWESSNYVTTDQAPSVIEMKIPYATIGFAPAQEEIIGVAFDVTDTRKEWKFWPADAEMTKPSTWGTASPMPAAQRPFTSNPVVDHVRHGEVGL
jgi:hypothetical protein